MSADAHKQIFEKTVGSLSPTPQSILDAGSGHTSITILCEMFPNAEIDAIIFPGDERKKSSVARAEQSCKYKLIEADIATTDFAKKYDLTIAHLLLGEAAKWGNDVPVLLNKLFPITKKYVMIADFPQDPEIDFTAIERLALGNGFKASKTIDVPSDPPFAGKTFQGDFYKAVLFERI